MQALEVPVEVLLHLGSIGVPWHVPENLRWGTRDVRRDEEG